MCKKETVLDFKTTNIHTLGLVWRSHTSHVNAMLFRMCPRMRVGVDVPYIPSTEQFPVQTTRLARSRSPIIVHFILYQGTNGIILSSSVEPEEGHVRVCPDTIITFTCSDTLVLGMRWSALPLLNEDNSPGLASSFETTVPIVVEDVFTITLVSRELRSDFRGNYTSTLDVVVNDRIQNGTTVICFTPNMAFLLIIKHSMFQRFFPASIDLSYIILIVDIPPPPSNLRVMTEIYSREEFTILLTWDINQNADSYVVSVNSTTSFSVENTTTFIITGEYNNLYIFTVTAVNCAGYSEEATVNCTIGIYDLILSLLSP